MSEEKSSVGFFDEEEEITLSENELNNILNNSTIELEEAVEDLQKIDQETGPGEGAVSSNVDDNLVIVSGEELEQEYLAKVNQVENPLSDFKVVSDEVSISTFDDGREEIVLQDSSGAVEEEKIELEEEPVIEEKIEELELEEGEISAEAKVEGEDEISASLNEVEEEEITIDQAEETPVIEEIKADEDLVIEEIAEDEIILDETPTEQFEEEIILEGDEIQEPEETQDLVIEEDVNEMLVEDTGDLSKELGEVSVSDEAIITEQPEVIAQEDIIEESVKTPPILEDTDELVIEEGVEDVIVTEDNAPVVEEKQEMPQEFFQEEKGEGEITVTETTDEMIVPEGSDLKAEMSAEKTENTEKTEGLKLTETEDAQAEKQNMEPENVKNVLLYLDSLFAYLPEDKIREFAKSKYYDMYNKIFDDLGL